MSAYDTYSSLVRQLDQHLTAETERTTNNDAAGTEAALAALETRLAAHAKDIVGVSMDLGLGRPRLPIPTPADVTEITAGLREATAAEATITTELEQAAEQGDLARLLPHASVRVRNAAVYSAWATLAVIGQWTLILTSDDIFTTVAWSLFGIPTLAVLAGFITCGFVGNPRPAGQQDRRAERSTGLGGAICFLALPLTWAAMKVIAAALS